MVVGLGGRIFRSINDADGFGGKSGFL